MSRNLSPSLSSSYRSCAIPTRSSTVLQGLRKWLSEHESRSTLKFTANLAFHLYSRQSRTEPRALIRELPFALALTYTGSWLSPRAVLFYSRGTSAFASVATPFNLAPGPIPLCSYLIRLSLPNDRFVCTHPFLPCIVSYRACFCISRDPAIYAEATKPWFRSLLH